MRLFTTIRLVNGSTGDPVLYLDSPGRDNALLFDGGDNAPLTLTELGDLEAVFLTHHHMDHFVGFDRILRANLDHDKILHVYGPEGTIRRVYDRIKSYEHGYFPFQKLVMRVCELLPGRMRTALLECARRFPVPEVQETAWEAPMIYENTDLFIEACEGDHTVPCWSYALIEKPGYHLDPEKLALGQLKPGKWVGQALDQLRQGNPLSTEMEIDGGRFTLGQLAEHYFTESPGGRLAYITDTAWTEKTRRGLVRLAKGAWRLYCDCFYAAAQAKQAATHRHMTVNDTTELARLAKVDQLVLIHFSTRYQGQYERIIEDARALFPRVSAEIPPSRGLVGA
jgi:ribonuclease Z